VRGPPTGKSPCSNNSTRLSYSSKLTDLQREKAKIRSSNVEVEAIWFEVVTPAPQHVITYSSQLLSRQESHNVIDFNSNI
jgi:hypothetical protein